MVESLIVLILDIIPLVFGCYIWYYGDGSKDQTIGQTTMVECLANLLPYAYSLILLYLSLTYIEKGQSLLLGGYRASEH